MEEVLFNRGGNRRALRLPENKAGIMSIVRWNLRPVIFGVDLGPRNRYFHCFFLVLAWPQTPVLCWLRFSHCQDISDVRPQIPPTAAKPRCVQQPKLSACAPLCCKNMCRASCFCVGGRGAVGGRSKQMSKGP